MTKSADHEPDRVDETAYPDWPDLVADRKPSSSRLLFLAGKFREAIGKCVCDSELHSQLFLTANDVNWHVRTIVANRN